MAGRPSALLDQLARATARVGVVGRALHGADTVFPAEYEITGEAVLAELFVLLAVDEDAEPFCCMCHGELDLVMHDRADRLLHEFQLHRPSGLGSRDWVGQVPLVRAPELVRLLDPVHPDGLPARQRRAWADAAPSALRAYATGWANGTTATATDDIHALAALATAFSGPHASRARALLEWLGTEHPRRDGARLLRGLVPTRLLAALPPAEITEALLTPSTPSSELHGAVAYFTSETFTSRHPKKRRLAAPARALLLRFARSFHPEQVKLLERRVLQGPDKS